MRDPLQLDRCNASHALCVNVPATKSYVSGIWLAKVTFSPSWFCPPFDPATPACRNIAHCVQLELMQLSLMRRQLHAGCRPGAACRLYTAQHRLPSRRLSVHALPVGEISPDLHSHIAAAFDLADAAAASASSTASSSGFLSPLTDTLESVLKAIQEQLIKYNVPYSYGYSIIILTAMVKLVTLPLTKKQVRSR